jgi:hypothetical protein
MKKILLSSLLFLSVTAFAQFDTPIIIDNTPASGGIKKIITADINNDGLNDIIVAQSFNIDNVACYMNNGDGTFGSKITIDANLDDPVCVASGDFNDDGWIDLAAITQTSAQVYVYLNNTEGGFTRQMIDDDFFFGNAIVIADFDENGSDDIVGIGQHSIDFYRNNGAAVFTKEHILTTGTSPNVLECMSICVADMNGDGHEDLVSGETLGGVIYFNDGNGTFTPQLFTDNLFITTFIHAVDINNDSFKDIILRHSSNNINLYINDGEGNMTFSSTLFTVQQIESMQCTDIDGDGFNDLYTAYTNKVRAKMNNGDSTFAPDTILYENNSQFTTQVALANIDSEPDLEFIWSAVGGILAYQKYNAPLSVKENAKQAITLYPNPASQNVTIALSNSVSQVIFYNALGQKVLEKAVTGTTDLDISYLSNGIYMLEVIDNSIGSIYKTKFVKK